MTQNLFSLNPRGLRGLKSEYEPGSKTDMASQPARVEGIEISALCLTG